MQICFSVKDLVLVQVAGPTLVPETHCSVGCCYIWSDCGQCGWPSTLQSARHDSCLAALMLQFKAYMWQSRRGSVAVVRVMLVTSSFIQPGDLIPGRSTNERLVREWVPVKVYRTSMDVPRESYIIKVLYSLQCTTQLTFAIMIWIITRDSMLLLFVIFIYNDLLMQMGAGSHFK